MQKEKAVKLKEILVHLSTKYKMFTTITSTSGDKVIIALFFPRAVTKSQLSTIAFCKLVHTEQLGSQWMNF